MATAAAQSWYPASAARFPRRRYDKRFFSVTAVLVLLTVFIASGSTDYFARAVRADAHLKMHAFSATRRFANQITVNHRRAS